jgi:hypothetical protein
MWAGWIHSVPSCLSRRRSSCCWTAFPILKLNLRQ